MTESNVHHLPSAGDRGPRKSAGGRRHSMMLSVLAILVLVAVVPIVLMGYNLAQDLEGDLAATQKEFQLSKGKAIRDDIARHVRSQFERLNLIADSVGTILEAGGARETAGVPVDRVREHLARYVHPDGFLNLQVSLPGAADGDVNVNSMEFDLDEVSEELAPLFQRAADKAGRATFYLSDPILPSRRPMQALCVLAVPVLDASLPGDRRPALIGVVSMAPIQRRVAAEGEAVLGYTVFVLDSDLDVFAHTQYRRVIERADLRDTPLVKEFAASGFAATSREFTLDQDGEPAQMLGAYAPVQLGDLRWGVFLQVDREYGLYQVTAMRRSTLMWGLIALACAVVIGIAFSLRITGPIHVLTESTRRVAGGEYGRRVTVRANNELGMLADNFNTMSEEINRTIEGLHRQRELNEQLFISSIRSLAAAIDARDPYTRGHSERVTRYARIIARQMKLPASSLRNIEIGALLHDVGKIGIEDRILRKPSALTPEEFEIMKTHPEKGGDIMEPIAFLREATDIIVHHHERWDGTGYPSGLKGSEIPLGARVVAVADTFDAMTTNRPYQRAMTFEIAARKIQGFSGKACDPGVVEAFVEAMDSGLFDVAGQKTQAG